MNAAQSPPLPASPTRSGRLRAWRLERANVEFAVLGMIATALAFGAAILLDLKAPGTAAITVWVVANTKPGHVLSKSVYRVVGTLLGAIASVAIVSVLAETPVLLFTALALWIAVCTGIGNLFRHFRAYAGLLAGYTAAFVVLGAYNRPDHVLDVALDRTSAIVIGVLAMSLVVSQLGARRGAADMELALRKLHRQCLDALRTRWDLTPNQLAGSRLALSRSHVDTDALLEYANLESPGFHLHIHDLRALTGLLLDGVDASRLAARQLDADGATAGRRGEIRAIFQEIADALEPAVTRQEEASVEQSRLALAQVRTLSATSADCARSDRERDALLAIVRLLDDWDTRLGPGALARARLHEPLLPDLRGAVRHVLRTFLGLSAAIAFWHLTGWQDGPAFIINGATFCALSSTMSHPAKALVMFSKATAVAAVAGFVCKFMLMPHATGYVSLMICLALVLIPLGCCAFSRRPQIDIIGLTSGLFLLALVQPSNHMSYDPELYLSSAIAAVSAGIFLSTVFSLVLPTRPEKEAARVLASLQRAVRGVTDRPLAPSFHAWRQTAHRRLRTLLQKPQVTPAELEAGLRLLDLGSCLLRLRGLARQLSRSPRSAVHAAILSASSRNPKPPALDRAFAAAEDPSIAPDLRATLVLQLRELGRLLPALSRPFPHDSGV